MVHLLNYLPNTTSINSLLTIKHNLHMPSETINKYLEEKSLAITFYDVLRLQYCIEYLVASKDIILERLSLAFECDSHLIWFLITTLRDWFKNLSQPIRSKTKTSYCDSLVHIFLHFTLATCINFASSFD